MVKLSSGRVLFGSRAGKVQLKSSGIIVAPRIYDGSGVGGTPAGHCSFQMAEPTPLLAPKTAPITPMTINTLMMKKPESSYSCEEVLVDYILAFISLLAFKTT